MVQLLNGGRCHLSRRYSGTVSPLPFNHGGFLDIDLPGDEDFFPRFNVSVEAIPLDSLDTKYSTLTSRPASRWPTIQLIRQISRPHLGRMARLWQALRTTPS